MRTRENLTIDRRRIEQPLRMLHLEVEHADQNPPLWKDLTYASVIALLLWVIVAALLV